MEKIVKVLQIAHGMETFGGVESYLLQYYREIDRHKVQWDFLFCCNNTLEQYVDDPIFEDSRITALHALKTSGNSLRNYVDLIRALNNYLDVNEYDVVHINTANVFLQFACAVGLKTQKIRVAHSHSAKAVMANPGLKDRIRLGIKSIIEPVLKAYIRKKNDYLFACSNIAGESLFGKCGIANKKFRIIRNAIEADRYVYNEEVRKKIRSEYSIDDKSIVYGTVGRLAESKNLLFLVDVFYEIHKMDSNSMFWLIGEGPMRIDLENKIASYDAQSYIKLLGEQSNIPNLLQALDCFVFATVYEGLGIVAVEAQAADLITIVSDAVPIEAQITDGFKYIELDKSALEWAEIIKTTMDDRRNRKDVRAELIDKGYDIKEAAKTLCSIYQNMVNGQK